MSLHAAAAGCVRCHAGSLTPLALIFLAEGECNAHHEKPLASICEALCKAQALPKVGAGALLVQLCSISPRNTSGKVGVRGLPEWVGREQDLFLS